MHVDPEQPDGRELSPDGNEPPLEDLRGAWRDLQPPLPADELDEADPETRAAVRWMRAAWQGLEAPEPRRLRPLSSVPARRAPRRALLAAAAAVLVMLGLRLVLRPDDETPNVAQKLTEEAPPSGVAYVGSDRMEMRSGPVRLILLTNKDA